jgi:beta-lactam-binding protein with PASTA domain
MPDASRSEMDALRQRLLAEAEDALADSIESQSKRRVAAFEAAARATLWSGFSGDADYRAGLSRRREDLARELDTASSDAFADSVAALRSVAKSLNTGTARVVGNLDSEAPFRGKAALVDKTGKVVASSPIDRLGTFVIGAPPDAGEVMLEIRDDQGRTVVVDGAPIRLEGPRTIGRSFSLDAHGQAEPVVTPAGAVMPDLTRKPMEMEAARAELDKLGTFNLASDEVFDDAPSGTVIGQVPAPNKPLSEGALVRLTVSLGPEPSAEMPDLAGKSVDEARLELSDLRIDSVVFETIRDPRNDGKIVAQKPKKGTVVGPRKRLVLTVGAAALRMPDVSGMTEVEATALLVPAFADAVRVTAKESDRPQGEVLGHDPGPGDRVGGGTVTLFVAGKAPTEPEKPREMPRLVGLTRTKALKELAGVGVTEPVFDPVAARKRGARVVSQHPPAKKRLRAGQNVSLEFGPPKAAKEK